MALKLRCPSCRDTFVWAGPWPDFCPKCGVDTSMGDRPEVAAPHISLGKARATRVSVDQTYRAMEAAGDANQQAAADMLGVDKSEMSGLKITDMKDNLREGDAAIKVPDNDVSRMVAAAPGALGIQGNNVGQFFAESTPKTGIGARAGAKARTFIQDFHQRTGAATVQAGERHRYQGS